MKTPAAPLSHKAIGQTRRVFIRSTSIATITTAVFPSISIAKGRRTAPSERINVAIIGCGPRGRDGMQALLNEKDCRIVAACDVKADQLEIARLTVNKRYGAEDCRTYHDFREVLARKDIDACLIATPDHWHVPIAIATAQAGKDIYLEKPIGLSVEEGHLLRKAVRKHNCVFQFGTQQRSGRMFWQACTLVRSGKIGKLRHINVWAPGSTPGGSLKQTPPPEGLDFDLWLGPAPAVPHTENLCSDASAAKTWWFVSAYALGFIAGWGIHPLDIALWGAGERCGEILEVEGRGTFRSTEGICDTATVWEINYKFENGLTMTYVGVPNGGNRSQPTGDSWLHEQEWRERYRRITTHGTAFEGSEGWVHVDREGVNLQPEDLIDVDPKKLPGVLTHSPGHMRNFLNCIRSRTQPVSDIDSAVASDTLCHISDIAIRSGRKLKFDFRAGRFIGDEEANTRLKSRPMRKPWHV